MKASILNLHECSPQDVFRTVADHLLTQNIKALGNDAACLYRTESGLKCAAGCLIPPEKYNPTWENSTWRGLASASKVPADHKDLIDDLQVIHDSENVGYWRVKLIVLGEKRGLDVSFLR